MIAINTCFSIAGPRLDLGNDRKRQHRYSLLPHKIHRLDLLYNLKKKENTSTIILVQFGTIWHRPVVKMIFVLLGLI